MDCSKTIVEPTLDSRLGHDFSGWYVEIEETCKVDGLKKNKCMRDGCGFVDTKVINKTENHTLVKVDGKAATCTEPGLTDGEMCSVCEKMTIAQEIIPALTHSFTKYEVTEEAKCGVAGKEVAICDRDGCGAKDEKVIAALEHNFSEYVYNKDATCTANGTKTAACLNGCGETDTVEAKDTMLDHADEDGDKICDSCKAEIKDTCPDCGGAAHADTGIPQYICILLSLFKLIFSFVEAFQ